MNKEIILKITGAMYLVILGICIGGIVLSAISASSIFNADIILRNSGLSDSIITKYDSGIIMSNIFVKFGYILNVSAIIILVYESLSFRIQKSGFFLWLLNILNVILIFLFTFYYTSKIIDMQEEGAATVGGIEFDSIHRQSELVFKILLVTLIISFISRVLILCIQNKKDKIKSPVRKRTKGTVDLS